MSATKSQPQESAALVLEACWNEIGVHGNHSCSTLESVVHCRNCAVYSKAGVQLLDRPLLPEYRQAWTEYFAQKRASTTPTVASVLLFRIASEWLALPTPVLQEVAERRPIHSLPHRRLSLVLGLVNIRGELLICVSLAHLLGLNPQQLQEPRDEPKRRLLVTCWHGQQVVFPVDEVCGVTRFPAPELTDPPAAILEFRAAFTQGILNWQGRSVGLLAPDLLYPALNRSLT